jgi:putative tryptophan/tyrosine transport system substrate-binding protein
MKRSSRSRRRFLIALAAAVAAGPRSARAQTPPRTARIGFLYFGSRQSALETGRYQAFIEALRELGYVEGTNLVLESRFADGRNERPPQLAAELVRLKVDVIVATGTPVYRALQHATRTIPIVLTVTADPVGDGFAASMARPGGNITGLSFSATDLGPKVLELLKSAVPKLARVAVLVQSENPAHPPQLKRIMSAAQKIGIQTLLAEGTTLPQIEQEFALMKKEHADAVIILPDPFFLQELAAIAAQALKHRLPSGCPLPEYAESGGLISYGPKIRENFRRVAIMVDKILKGARPGELPFEQPTRYYLTINRKTATALGLTLPQMLLSQADELTP